MIDFSKQIEDLRKEITEAIIGLLRRHGLTGLEFPESGTVPNAPDSVYVIFFDDDGDPFECIIKKVSVMGNSLYRPPEKSMTDTYSGPRANLTSRFVALYGSTKSCLRRRNCLNPKMNP